jgi:hypothetical protein
MLCTFFSSTLARVKIKIFLTCLVAASAFGQWNPQKSNTTAAGAPRAPGRYSRSSHAFREAV